MKQSQLNVVLDLDKSETQVVADASEENVGFVARTQPSEDEATMSLSVYDYSVAASAEVPKSSLQNSS